MTPEWHDALAALGYALVATALLWRMELDARRAETRRRWTGRVGAGGTIRRVK